MGLTPGWMAALMRERYTKVCVMVSECINVPKPLPCTEVSGIWEKDRGRYVHTHIHCLNIPNMYLIINIFTGVLWWLQGVMYYNQAATSWYKGQWVNNCREGWGTRWYVILMHISLFYFFFQIKFIIMLCSISPYKLQFFSLKLPIWKCIWGRMEEQCSAWRGNNEMGSVGSTI